MSLLSNIDSGSILVWKRNGDVFFKTWKTNFLPSILEPLLYLLAMGFGFGGLVTGLTYAGIIDVNYARFLAPGLIAISVMYSAFFECTYGTFVRMHFQKTFDAIIATPVTIEDVIVGEILWGATKSFANATLVLVVVEVLGLTLLPPILFTSPAIFLIPIVCFVGGLMFASIAIIFTAVVPNIDSFNYPFYLLVTPMFLLSGTFFPISQLGPVQYVALLLPLTHVTNLIRDFCFGTFQMWDLWAVIYIPIVTAAFLFPSIYLMKKRLIS